MPKTTKSGKPKQDELPSTLQRSAKKAQRTFTKAYDAAADQYGSAKRANQTACGAVGSGMAKTELGYWLPAWHCCPVLHMLPVLAKVSASLQQGGSSASSAIASGAGCCIGQGVLNATTLAMP